MEYLIRMFNPHYLWGEEKYDSFGEQVLNIIFMSPWSVVIFFSLIGIGVWFGARRQRIQVGYFFFIAAGVVLYGGGLCLLIKAWS